MSSSNGSNEEKRPFLRVVRGNPDEAEIAALTAALAAAAATRRGDKPAPPPSAWADLGARLRQPLRPGPGAWQASGRHR